MKISKIIFISLILSSIVFAAKSNAQDEYDDEGLDEEVTAVEGQVEPRADLKQSPKSETNLESTLVEAPPVADEKPVVIEVPKRNQRNILENELKLQKEVLDRKKRYESEVSSDRNIDRFPKQEPLFRRPPGPVEGGTVRVEHPRAAEGLLRVNRDGSYQYRTTLKDKSQGGSMKLSSMSPPKIKSGNITFESMYGSSNLTGMTLDYEWFPFRKFGALGIQLESGFSTATARGNFKTARPDGSSRSEEKYNIFIVPMTAFLNYRFEYVRRQWIVPYVNGGFTYYGLSELRNDGKTPVFAGAPAAGGGGGVLISLSRLDSAGAFTLSQEYGIADMWLAIEGRAMQGLSDDTDFTNQTINVGIVVDF